MFIIEILDDDIESEMFLEREQYWISYFGSDNSLLGYNTYTTPRNTQRVLNDSDTRMLIHDIKTSGLKQAELASKYGISKSLVGAIKTGKRRKIPGETYPILSYQEQQKIEKITRCLQMVENGTEFDDIARELELSSSTVRNYNLGNIPLWCITHLPKKYVFPIREIIPAKKTVYSSYNTCLPSIKTKKHCTPKSTPSPSINDLPTHKMLADGLDTIILRILETSMRNVAKEYEVSDSYLKKLLKRHNMPYTRSDMLSWLDDHPALESTQRVPSKTELIQAIETLEKFDLLLEHFSVKRDRFKSWLAFREIEHDFKNTSPVKIVELDIIYPTINDAARFLVEKEIVEERDPIKVGKDIAHALDRANGKYTGLTFHRIKDKKHRRSTRTIKKPE